MTNDLVNAAQKEHFCDKRERLARRDCLREFRTAGEFRECCNRFAFKNEDKSRGGEGKIPVTELEACLDRTLVEASKSKSHDSYDIGVNSKKQDVCYSVGTH